MRKIWMLSLLLSIVFVLVEYADEGDPWQGGNQSEFEQVENERVTAIDSEREELDALHAMQDELEIELNELVAQTSGIIGISYYCLTTGRHIAIQADHHFFDASLGKATGSYDRC